MLPKSKLRDKIEFHFSDRNGIAFFTSHFRQFFDDAAEPQYFLKIQHRIGIIQNDVKMCIRDSIYSVLGSLYFMFVISKPLILIFAVTVPISVIFTKIKAKKIQPLFRKRSRKLGEMNGFAEEMLSGAKTINAYDQAENVTAKFDERNRAAVDSYYDAEYYGAMIGPSVNFINNLSLSLIMIFGGVLYLLSQNGTVAAGTIWFITLGGVTQFVLSLIHI